MHGVDIVDLFNNQKYKECSQALVEHKTFINQKTKSTLLFECYCYCQEWDLALDILEQLTAFPQLYHKALIRFNELKYGLELCWDPLSLDPWVHYRSGLYQLKIHRFAVAAVCFKQALQLDPSLVLNKAIKRAYGLALLFLGQENPFVTTQRRLELYEPLVQPC